MILKVHQVTFDTSG